jgi:DNA-binding transcriptional LysR family regulator
VSNTLFASLRRDAAWYAKNRMSLTQLESFVAVAEEQHVGRAAHRLHVTQPPLTRRIRNLEAELGVELFERTARGMRLLPQGEILLDHAREILRRVEQARASVTSGMRPPGRTRPTPPPESHRERVP